MAMHIVQDCCPLTLMNHWTLQIVFFVMGTSVFYDMEVVFKFFVNDYLSWIDSSGGPSTLNITLLMFPCGLLNLMEHSPCQRCIQPTNWQLWFWFLT